MIAVPAALLLMTAATAVSFLMIAAPVAAQTSPPETTTGRAGHGAKGFEIASEDGDFLMQIQARLQFRMYSGRLGEEIEDDEAVDGFSANINRVRLKIGGHGYRPWLTYFFEYELQGNALLDFRVEAGPDARIGVRVGQWKSRYSRERITSSGEQQMMDRSIINSAFTLDRQQGMSLLGRLGADGPVDVNYWVELLTGTGRGGEANDDRNPLWMGRLQWNAFGDPIDFEGSALGDTEELSGLVAFGAATNRSPYTAFSQDGGGQLPGFTDGQAGQYRITQYLVESAAQYRGISWEHETHWKTVDDTFQMTETRLLGTYAEIGILGNAYFASWPRPLEVAFRWAVLDPSRDRLNDIRQEWGLASNWFFSGHSNKLTAETTLLTQRSVNGDLVRNVQFRLQWELSF
jgi:phosphate-selective porin OprO and OprP